MKAENPSFHKAADTGPAFWGPGDTYTFLATGAETNGAYFAMEGLIPPDAGPPPHIHHSQDESFYLVEGQLEVKLGDQIIEATAGDFVHIAKGTPHAFVNRSQAPARMILTFVPAGDIEQYFRSVFGQATDRHAPPPPITDAFIQNLLETSKHFDVEFLPR